MNVSMSVLAHAPRARVCVGEEVFGGGGGGEGRGGDGCLSVCMQEWASERMNE